VKDGYDNRPITTLEEFLNVVDEAEEPFFWMCPADDSTQDTDVSETDIAPPNKKRKRTTERTRTALHTSLPEMIGHNRRPDYGSHPILELEAELKQTNDEAQIRYAQSRFNLIRENHRHSADLVAELQQFFAELDRDTTEIWQKLSQRRKLCENNMTDPTQSNKLYGFVAELRGADRTFAEQYVGLMESNNPLAEHATKELVKLLVPDAAEWEEVSRKKRIFDELRGDTTESEGPTTQI